MECRIVDFSIGKSDNEYTISHRKVDDIHEKENKLKSIKLCDDMDELVSIVYSKGTDLGKLIKENGIWLWEGESNLIANQAKVEQNIETLIQISPIDMPEETEDLETYGLKEPPCSIVLTDTNGKTTAIYIGDATEEGHYYVTVDEKEEVYIMEKEIEEVVTSLRAQKRLSEQLDATSSPTP